MIPNIALQTVLDGLGHGVLIFSGDGKLVQYNLTAGTILGADLNLIKAEGWQTAVALFDTNLRPQDMRLEAVREQALQAERPIRFKIYRSGQYIPCWAAAVPAENGEIYLMLTLDVADWRFVGSVIDRFRKEMRDTIDSTAGHISLINRTLKADDPELQDPATAKIARRVGGFTRLIDVHMSRAGRLIRMLDRLQDLRTGDLRDKVRTMRKKIDLADFLEDFVESLDEIQLLDPEAEAHDYRARVRTEIEDGLVLYAVPFYLETALREMLRNAIMYSLLGTPIIIKAVQRVESVQIEMIDEGYGVRQSETERVFEAFERARQPQIIAEFGYGLALYLSKHELEAMNGRLWFKSEENAGTTFSIQLPLWHPEAEAISSSSSQQEP